MTVSSATRNWLQEMEKWPRDPLRYYVEFPFRETYYPYGLPLEISTNHKGVLAAAQQSWGPFPQLQSAPPIHLRFGVSGVGSQLPPQPTYRAQRGLISIISDAENFGICDVTGGFGFSWVSAATIADPSFFRYHFLELMAGMILTSVHFAVVQAACVAYKGHGFLLCGHSGSGKSTLAFACANRGWAFISGEAAHVPHACADGTVVGNPLYLRLRPDAASLFPQLRQQAIVLRQNGEFGFEMPTDNLPGVATAFRCKVDHIVFLRRNTVGLAKLAPFSKEEAQRRLEQIVEYTFACKPPCDRDGCQSEMALANPEVREQQKASLRHLLSADVHELSYSSLDDAIDCLESVA